MNTKSALTQSTESFTQLFTERNQLFPERILIAAIRDQSIFKEIFKVCNDETCELLSCCNVTLKMFNCS